MSLYILLIFNDFNWQNLKQAILALVIFSSYLCCEISKNPSL